MGPSWFDDLLHSLLSVKLLGGGHASAVLQISEKNRKTDACCRVNHGGIGLPPCLLPQTRPVPLFPLLTLRISPEFVFGAFGVSSGGFRPYGMVELIVELGVKPGDHVLDFGCGISSYAVPSAQMPYHALQAFCRG